MWTEKSIQLRKEAEELIARGGKYEAYARSAIKALIAEAEMLEEEAGMKTVPMRVEGVKRRRRYV